MVTASTTLRVQAAPEYVRAVTLPETFDRERLSFQFTASTGARVLRRPLFGEPFYEELGLKPGEVRLGRLQSGAPILDSHRRWSVREGDVLGVVESVELVPDKEIRLGGRFSKREALEDVRADVADGILRQFSLGYRVFKFRDVSPEGATIKVLRAVDWEPFEASLLAVGADGGANIRSEDDPLMERAADLGPHECTIETTNPEAFRTMAKKPSTGPAAQPGQDPPPEGAGTGAPEGQPNPESGGERGQPADPPADPPTDPPTPTSAPAPSTRTEDPPAPANPASAAPNPPADPPAPDAAQVRAQERERQAGIRELATRYDLPDAWSTRQIDGDVALESARVRALEAVAERDVQTGRGGSHVTVLRGEHEAHARGIETWILHRCGYQERAEGGDLHLIPLDDAARQFRGMSMVDLGRWWLENAAGVSCRGLIPYEIATRALHGTSHFPEVLGNIATKFLRRAYDESPRTFRRFATRTDLPDFKQAKHVQLAGAPSLVKLEAQGEVTRGPIGEYAEPAVLSTYARMVGYTRQAMTNDDLGAFSRIPRAFGAAAAATETDLAYALWTDNVTMSDGDALFHANHANLSTGVLTASDLSGLSDLRLKMREQTGIEGRKLNLQVRYLIVPAALETTAQQVTAAINPNAPTGVNPFATQFQGVIVEPRLDATSTVQYYGTCDPALCDTLIYGYLQGMGEGPRVETKAGWNIDGTEIRCLHDFYVIAADFRGMVRSSGA